MSNINEINLLERFENYIHDSLDWLMNDVQYLVNSKAWEGGTPCIILKEPELKYDPVFNFVTRDTIIFGGLLKLLRRYCSEINMYTRFQTSSDDYMEPYDYELKLKYIDDLQMTLDIDVPVNMDTEDYAENHLYRGCLEFCDYLGIDITQLDLMPLLSFPEVYNKMFVIGLLVNIIEVMLEQEANNLDYDIK